MNISVKNLKDLSKKMTIEVPIAEFDKEFDKAINGLKNKVKIDGFRQGKVPTEVIKQKYGANLRSDAANNVIGEFLPKAFEKEKLNPAGQPELTNIDFDNKERFIFTVDFEVFPEVKIADLSKLKIVKVTAKVTEADTTKTLDGLKQQATVFKKVDRQSQNNDKIKIDFVGFVDGKKFNGGESKDFDLVLGSKSMIPGFEDGLIGKKAGDKVKLKATFPKEYQAKDLANKDAVFETIIKEVSEPKAVEVNDEFAKKFGKNNVDELLSGIKSQMQIELDNNLDKINKDASFNALIEANNITVPQASVSQESKNLLKAMQKKMQQQNMNIDNSKMDESLFKDEAKRRVQLGLLVTKITDDNKIIATDEQVNTKLKIMSQQYDATQKQQMLDYYKTNVAAFDGVRSLVIENLVVDFIMGQAEVSEISKKFTEIAGQQQ